MLKWGREQQQNLARPVQDAVCQYINLLLEGNKEGVKFAVHSNIVEEFQALIGEILPVDDILPFHLLGIDYICQLYQDQIYTNIFNIRIDQSVIRILKSNNSEVVEIAADIILRSIFRGIKCFENFKPHLFAEAIENDGIVNTLYEDVLIKEGTSKKAKNKAAISIGRLYERTQMPEKYANIVILQMKKGMKSEIKDIQVDSLSVLSSLTQNQDCIAAILSNNFLVGIIFCLRSDDNEILVQSLQLTENLFVNGSEDIKEQISNKLPADVINQYMKSNYQEIYQSAQKVNSWIKRRNEMTQLAAIKQQIQLKASDNRDQLVEQGAFKQICGVFRQGIKEEDEYSGVVLFGCEIAQQLLKNNKRVIQAALEDDGLFDSIVAFLHSIPPDKIMPDHIQTLYQLLLYTSEEQMKQLYNKQIIGAMCLSLSTTNEQKLDIYINKIFQYIYYEGEKLKEGQSFPLKAIFEADGTISRLVQLLHRIDLINIKIKHTAAVSIGTIFKATILPKEIKSIVINQIKLHLYNQDDSHYSTDLKVLKYIAECKCVL
ncbi:MAG: hypothetical protein EZS28_019860 [Streblomastix strix]|uniref:Uncharacterized protein n=1 Tax=Streblomastix strix TaxID=222440 RepID=A0A5J4VPT8_9EUKA|nr:MAG: hypothetical protein EZS28_019860 [Streblomastix strix]